MASQKNNLWVEKYRPTTLDEYSFQNESHEKTIRGYIDSGFIPNLILSGVQGTGKSTLWKVIMNEFQVDRSDILFVDASSRKERGIDMVERIDGWCKIMPIGEYRYVILEEASGLTFHAQESLKNVTERYSDTVRFIFTTNNLNKINPVLQSRCSTLVMESFNDDAILEYIQTILEKEQINPTDDQLGAILKIVEAFSPDLRKIIHNTQKLFLSGHSGALDTLGDSEVDQFRLLWNSDKDSGQILEESLKFSKAVTDQNYRDFYRIMYERANDFSNVPNFVIVVAEHLYKANLVADQDINFSACLYSLLEG